MNGDLPAYPLTHHDHQLDLVLLCGTCGLVIEPRADNVIALGLASLAVTSDNLTSAQDAEADLLLTASMGTD